MVLTCLLYVVTFIKQLIIIFMIPPCIVIYFKVNQIHYILEVHCIFSYVLTSQNRSVVVTRSTRHVVECASHTAVATSSAELHVAQVAPARQGTSRRVSSDAAFARHSAQTSVSENGLLALHVQCISWQHDLKCTPTHASGTSTEKEGGQP